MLSLRRTVGHAASILTIVAACIAGMPSSALAAAELTVSPTIMQLEAAAGDELTEEITASAGADQAIVVELSHADFGFTGRDYQIVLVRDDAQDTTAFSTRGWFSLPRKRYRIPAGTSKVLPLSIKVPRNTPGGTYLGAALLRVVPPKTESQGSQVQAVPETGPLLFIAVDGGAPPKPKISKFELPSIVTRGPIRPKIIIDNRGDEFFTFEGKLTLSGPGKDATAIVSRQFVVPDEPRDLRSSADGKGRDGDVTLGSRQLGFGRYEVKTRLRIEPTGRTLVATRTVWVVPMWVRIVLVLVALVLITCIALLVRWFLQRRREHDGIPLHDDSLEDDSLDDESLDDESLGEVSLDEDSLHEDSLDEDSLDEDSSEVDPRVR